MNKITHHQFSNGLVLLGEFMPSAQSLAMSFLLPGGVVHEPTGQLGVATVLSEMLFRGAGDLDARAHSDAMDDLGLQRDSSVDGLFFRLSATMIGSHREKALPLLMDMIRRPLLTDEAFKPSRDLALQTLDALEDEPQQKTFIALRQRHYQSPLNRPTMGQKADLEALTAEQVRQYQQQVFVPQGAILSFAGQFDWEALKEQVGQLLGDWDGQSSDLQLVGEPLRGYEHITSDSNQVHIGLAYDAVNETHENAMLQRAAAAVLSGGMSGRLFTEVREKRGLCYAVYAAYAANRHMGVMLSYAGTTTARAQETLDVLAAEHRRLSEGIEPAEFCRAMVGMKTRLVMQGQSTHARASAIAMDQHTFDEPRTLDQWIAQVDAITFESLNDYVKLNAAGPMTTVTIGPGPLKV